MSDSDLLRARTGAAPAKTTPKPITSLVEFQKQKVEHDKDVKRLQDDLKLLSALLGRPISVAEIPTLINQVGKSTGPSTLRAQKSNALKSTVPATTSTPPTTTTIQPLLWTLPTVVDTTKYVEANTRNAAYYGKSNEAVIATILKSQGIGPENNNIPIEVSSHLMIYFVYYLVFVLSTIIYNNTKTVV